MICTTFNSSKPMATLQYNEITSRKCVLVNGEPYEVLESSIMKKQQRKPVNQVKLRNMINGSIMERTFQASETADEADMDTKKITFIYERNGEYNFHEAGDKSARFSLSGGVIGDAKKFLKQGAEIDALVFTDPESDEEDAERIVGVRLPVKMEFKVVEAPPNVKGGTAQGGNKQVTIETGARITTPMFVEEGDVIRVNTERGEYTERV